MIILNSPHNPSGALISRAELDQLAALIRDRDIYLVSDEVYEHLVFDGVPMSACWPTKSCISVPSWSARSARPTTSPAGRPATWSRRRR
jgi:aspartate/methionine/tyrosine aminotransferase